MSLVLVLALTSSTLAQTAPFPRADLDRCTAYYLMLGEQAPPADAKTPDLKTAAYTGFWVSSLAVQMTREGATLTDVNARLRSIMKENDGLTPDPSVRDICEADVAALKAQMAPTPK